MGQPCREDLLAIDGQDDGDALGARRQIVRAAADRILDAIDAPTMLVFDDLHWTDELSLEVIGELARHSMDRPLVLVGGYRADEFPADGIHREWRGRILGQRHAEEARLRPLTLEETGIATTLILGGELPAPRDVVEAVHERTNGIPLHVEELLAALDDDARADGRRIREAHVPDTIGDAVLARVDRLSPDARALVRACAVIGRCFSPDVLAGVMDRPLSELEATLQELEDAAIISPFNYVDHGYYDFRHQLLRDAIYDTVPPSELRRYHAQAAEFVIDLKSSSVVHVSRHYERAGLAAAGIPHVDDRSGRGEPDLGAAGGVRALPAGNREHARRPAASLEQAELFEPVLGARPARLSTTRIRRWRPIRARQLYLEAGRPIQRGNAAADHVLRRAAPRGADREPARLYWTRRCAEIADLPATPDRERMRAWLLTYEAEQRFVALDLKAARERAQQARELADIARRPRVRPRHRRSSWGGSTSSPVATRAACATACAPPATLARQATSPSA